MIGLQRGIGRDFCLTDLKSRGEKKFLKDYSLFELFNVYFDSTCVGGASTHMNGIFVLLDNFSRYHKRNSAGERGSSYVCFLYLARQGRSSGQGL